MLPVTAFLGMRVARLLQLLHLGEVPDPGIVDLVVDRYEEVSAGLSG